MISSYVTREVMSSKKRKLGKEKESSVRHREELKPTDPRRMMRKEPKSVATSLLDSQSNSKTKFNVLVNIFRDVGPNLDDAIEGCESSGRRSANKSRKEKMAMLEDAPFDEVHELVPSSSTSAGLGRPFRKSEILPHMKELPA